MMDPETWGGYRRDMRAFASFQHADPSARLSYFANGLVGEAGEALDAVLGGGQDLDELADVAWYLAMAEEESGLRAAWPGRPPMWSAVEPPDDGLFRAMAAWSMVRAAALAAEEFKRPIAGRDMRGPRASSALDDVALHLDALAWRHGGVAAVLARSRAKIAGRFCGARWSAEAQRARDAAGAP